MITLPRNYFYVALHDASSDAYFIYLFLILHVLELLSGCKAIYSTIIKSFCMYAILKICKAL